MINQLKNKYLQHRETIHNFKWRAIQVGAKQGTTFLIFFIAAYFLMPEQLGLFSYLMAVIGLFMIICDFGFSPSTSKYVAELKTKNSKKLNSVLFSISTIIILMATLVSLSIVFFGKYIFEEYTLLLLLIPYLYFMPLSSVADGVYRGLKDFKKLSFISIVVAIISLPTAFILIKSYGLIGAIISQNLLFGLLTIGLFVFRKDMEFNFDKDVTKKVVRYAVIIGLANIAFFLYTRVDILILKQFGFIAEIGYYEIVNKVFKLLFIPAVILGQVLAPNTTRYITLNDYKTVKNKIIKILPMFIVGGIILSLILYFIFPIIIKIFFTEYYTEAFITIMTILLILLPIKLWGVFLTNGFITPGGFAKITAIATMLGGISNVILSLIFINYFGFLGVFFATLIVHTLSILIQFLFFILKLKNE
ncbi:MAG: oligosaccharide flippase family protein [Patescibacteria group bacterium]|nr:oligosaccharide flippase family protein [Patescibacteria group bacterium]